MKSYRVYIDNVSRDCEVGIIDSSRIYRFLIENDHKFTNDPSIADYIIINSCGFIKGYEKRSINLYDKYNSLKKKNAKIIIFGCLIKINPELIKSLDVYTIDLNELEKFDKFFYKKTKLEDIKPYCDNVIKEKILNKNNVEKPKYRYFFLTDLMLPYFKKLRLNYNKIIDSIILKNRLLVEISKGCMGNCSFCIIKRARGKLRSRPIKDILVDIEKIKDSAKKLYLVANDCGFYGVDIKTNLINLLNEINKKFPEQSIELDYLNPFLLVRYSDEYVKLFKNIAVDYITIPMQSGSKKILKSMNRNYDPAKTIKTIDKIKKASPETFIFSHFIIGFPGENWIDFFKTMICAMHFDLSVPFKYSKREGTDSASFQDQISESTISKRIILFLIVINLIVFFRLISYPNNQK